MGNLCDKARYVCRSSRHDSIETDDMAALARYHCATAVEQASRTGRYVVSLVTDTSVQVGPETEVVHSLLRHTTVGRGCRLINSVDRGPSGVASRHWRSRDPYQLPRALDRREERVCLLRLGSGPAPYLPGRWRRLQQLTPVECGHRGGESRFRGLCGGEPHRSSQQPAELVQHRLYNDGSLRAIWAPKSAKPSW